MSVATVISRGLAGTGHRARDVITGGLASYTGLPEPPLAGYQYGAYLMSWAGNGFWLGRLSTPAPVLGDVFMDTITSPGGYATPINADGTVNILVGGDSSRQSFRRQIYRVAGNTIDGPATEWINETPAVWGSGIKLPQDTLSPPVYTGTAITPINLAGSPYAVSPWGDTLTFTLGTGDVPPGLSLSSAGVLSGTPIQAGSFTFTVIATDAAGVPSTSPNNNVSITPVYVPPPVGGVTAVFGPVVSAWTADATKITADSVSFTCDGADLINGGGSEVPQPPSKGPAITKSQYLRF